MLIVQMQRFSGTRRGKQRTYRDRAEVKHKVQKEEASLYAKVQGVGSKHRLRKYLMLFDFFVFKKIRPYQLWKYADFNRKWS